jgi:protein ImuB
MRLACLYLPVLPLQMAVREQPGLVGRAVVVVGGGDRPEIAACSRAAFEAGVRPGMSPSQARLRSPDLAVVVGCPARWREEIAALAAEIGRIDGRASASEALAPSGGVAAHPVLFAQVPAGQRSERFGRALLDIAAARGVRGRVGIAADRFTARAAARARGASPVVVVPRAAAAEFLAPLPIELLPLRDEVRLLLRAAGVTTLGAFAALPPPSSECRAAGDVDYQELARGNGPAETLAAPPAEERAAGDLAGRRPALRSRRPRRAAPERQLHLAG